MTEPQQPPDLTAPVIIAGLAVQADKLAAAATKLATATRQHSESYRFSRQLKFIMGGFLILLGLLIVIAAINLANGHAIKSCTTPTGACYLRNQQTTTKAVGDIVAGVNAHTDLVLLATLECSRHNYTDAQFATCLHDKGVR